MQKISIITLFLVSQSLLLSGVQRKPGRVVEFQINRSSSSVLDTFKNDIRKGYVIVDFHAPWCGPCKSFAPTFSDLSSSSAYENITFIKVDIDDYPEIAKAYNVRSIPQLSFFKNGTSVRTCTGKKTKNEVIKELNELLK